MTEFLLLAFVFLIAGVIAVPIATRLGLGSVLGYLIAGIAISPILVILGVDVVSIQHFAEFGVVMMLFLVGLELEPRKLWQMRMRLAGLGGGQLVLTIGAITGIAMVFGQPWTIALAIGLVLALSSTAIVLQTLNEKGLMKSDGGQSSFSVLLSQDVAVIPILALLPLLAMPELAGYAHGAEGDHAEEISLIGGLAGWQIALINVSAIAAVILGGIYLTRPVFRYIAMANMRELFTAAALLMVIGIALLMTLVGLSPALGTFLAGVVLANSEYRHELESDVDPFKGLLLGLFFMTVGAGINFALLYEGLALIVGLTLGLMVLKAVILLILSLVMGPRGADRWLMALGLAQAGEFGFVLLSVATANAVLPEAIADQLLLVVALSMLLTPALYILYDRVIAPRYEGRDERAPDTLPGDAQVIIAGRGRIGGIVDRMLSAAGYKTTVIDYSSRQLEDLRTFGITAYFGDATRPDLLAAAGIDRAKLFVIAIDGNEQITSLVKYVVKTYPHVHVIARATNRHHVYELWAAGCRDIIRESYDGSIRIGRSAFEALGISREHASQMAEAFDDHDRHTMLQVADAYDPDIPPTQNQAYIDRIREVLEPEAVKLHARMRDIRGLDDPG